MHRVGTVLVICFLCLCLAGVLADEPKMRVHIIDVGQGDATLLEFGNGAILVDAGGEKNRAYNSSEVLQVYLDGFFAKREDLGGRLLSLVITHPHIDHTRGIAEVLEHYEPRNAVTNGRTSGSGGPQQRKLHRVVRDRERTPSKQDDIGFFVVEFDSVGTVSPVTNEVIDPAGECGGVDPVIQAVWGAIRTDPGDWGKAYGKPLFDNENNHSIVLRVDFGQASVLLTADAQEPAIDDMLAAYKGSSVLDADVYRVGHHGSHNGTTGRFIKAISPQYAVISMGPAWRELRHTAWAYGHPRETVLDLLLPEVSSSRRPTSVKVATSTMTYVAREITKAVYATGWDGTVVLEATKDGTWSVIKPPAMVEPPANTDTPPAPPSADTDTPTVRSLVNINTADLATLMSLPGIGQARARAILAHRAAHGDFNSIEGLADVDGIGPATMKVVRPLITVE